MRMTLSYLALTPIDLQIRFTILEKLASLIGLTLNKDKTVLLLAKVKHKSTTGNSKTRPNRAVYPFDILYTDTSDNITQIKAVEQEIYLGTTLSRNRPALPEL